jgi:prepilin-type N-terminal cleavage/methylation domain-containing protein
MKNHLKNNKGFTLVELLIVIALIGIVLAIAMPNISDWLPRYRLKQAANDLYSNLQLTKLRSVKDNKDWAVVFDNVSGRYYICSDWGADSLWSTPGDNAIEKTITLSLYNSGVGYGHGSASINATDGGALPDDEIDYTDNVVVFNSRGICDGGFVYLRNELNTTAYAVGTQVSGAVVLRKWQSTAWN